MFTRLGLDWRLSLTQECWFYFRTCRNWRDVWRARLWAVPLDCFQMRGGQVIGFSGLPPWEVFQEIWRYQSYSKKYPRRWSSPQSVVDIGANVGFFSLFAARSWPLAKIWAFEPAPENVRWLERNVRLSGAQQVTVRSLAVAGTCGQRKFHLKEQSGWHSFWEQGSLSDVLVETRTLENIIAEIGSTPIGLLKMDCEGAEYEVLQGRSELLARSVRFVAMEYHEKEGHTVQELINLFESAGFHSEYHAETRWGTGMLYATNARLEPDTKP